MTKLQHTQDILRDLIAFPSISSQSNMDIITYCKDHLESLGARVEIFADADQPKANLWATIGPDTDGGIVLSGHTDVVPVEKQPWTHDPFDMIERDGNLYGRGTCDMKGFIACALAMAEDYAKLDLTRPVHFAFSYDEETGCMGAAHLVKDIKASGRKPSMCIIGEPTEMRVIEGHKAIGEYTATFEGLAGHGSAPDLGVNAAEYAVKYVSKLLELREALKSRTPKGSQFDPPWTTINIGKVEGGIAHNVIVDRAVVEWEMRPVVRGDRDYVIGEIDAYVDEVLRPAMQAVYADAQIHVECLAEVVGLEPMDDNEAKRVVIELTGANTADLVAFGTEAGLFQSIGMSAVVCGPGSIAQAHRADEFIAIDQLAKCLEMLGGLKAKIS